MPFSVLTPVTDIIIPAIFYVEPLKSFWEGAPPKVPFLILFETTVTIVLHYRADCDIVQFWVGVKTVQLAPNLHRKFEPWGSCNTSSANYTDKRYNVNTHKLAAVQQRRKITISFNSSLLANDIAAPYSISCVWVKSWKLLPDVRF